MSANWKLVGILPLLVLGALSDVGRCVDNRGATQQAGPGDSNRPAETKITVGMDAERAKEILKVGWDWTVASSYLVSSGGPDHQRTARYYRMPDGLGLSLYLARQRVGEGDQWTAWVVDGMAVQDSMALRGIKAEQDFTITSLAIADGKSQAEGLPSSAIHFHLSREEILHKMKAYGWARREFSPFKGRLNRYVPWYGEAPSIMISPEDGWEAYVANPAEVFLRFPPGDSDKKLVGILFRLTGKPSDANALPMYTEYEILDQHLLTVERYQRILHESLPEGWTLRSGGHSIIRLGRKSEYEKEFERDEVHVLVLWPMSPEGMEKKKARLPGIRARLAELEKKMEDFTKDGVRRPRNREDQQICDEYRRLRNEIYETPAFLTAHAAVCITPITEAGRAEYDRILEAVRSALRKVDP